MAQQESYCLDVFMEGDEILRENLLDFLKKEKSDFGITCGQFGMWGTMRTFRVLTPQAKALTFHIIRTIKGAEDYSYDEYYSQKKAENSMFWDPDKNKQFEIIESCFG
jgi:hypothetical protein